MLVHIFQADGHERDREIATVHHAKSAALAAVEEGNMQKGDRAEICITSHNPATAQFENAVWNVQFDGEKVFLVVDGEPRFVGTVCD